MHDVAHALERARHRDRRLDRPFANLKFRLEFVREVREILFAPATEIIEHTHAHSVMQQRFTHMRSDEASATSDQHRAHRVGVAAWQSSHQDEAFRARWS